MTLAEYLRRELGLPKALFDKMGKRELRIYLYLLGHHRSWMGLKMITFGTADPPQPSDLSKEMEKTRKALNRLRDKGIVNTDRKGQQFGRLRARVRVLVARNLDRDWLFEQKDDTEMMVKIGEIQEFVTGKLRWSEEEQIVRLVRKARRALKDQARVDRSADSDKE